MKKESKTSIESEEPKKLPRMVEAKYRGHWQEVELLADLTGMGVEYPYVTRGFIHKHTILTCSEIREIEEEKKPLSFGDYIASVTDKSTFVKGESATKYYESYQTYLKEFNP